MGRYLVIENETKLFKIVEDVLKSLDSTADIVHAESYNLFENKLNHLPENEKHEFFKFNLILLGLPEIPLKDWKKTIDDLRGKVQSDCPICLTAFESSSMTTTFLKQLDIYNVVYKPCDPLILKETLSMALQKRKLAQTVEIKSQKSSAFIGVLKEVELQSISELGFLTFSDAAIPVMSVTKYFSPLFKVGIKQSVWAQCLLSMPHPQKPGQFINKFQFYHVKKDFLNMIRKYLVNFKSRETASGFWNLATTPSTKKFRMALVGVGSRENLAFQKEIEMHFTNLAVEFMDLSAVSTWPQKLEHELVLNLSELPYEDIKKYFKIEAKYFWLPAVAPNEDKLTELSQQYLEIFTQPYDRSYFYKKLKALINELIPTEVHYLLSITCHDKIKAANTVKVTEVNEVFVNFHYSRELEFNSFREFIFLNKDDEAAIEIPAFCHYKEKENTPTPGEKNIYFHQFAFYAMTDHFLKEIRLWLLHNHVSQSKK